MSGPTRIAPVWQRLALAGAVTLAGCGPGFGPAGVTFAVRSPPREVVEVRGVAPGPGYVWIGGHYNWQANDYVWVGGRWDRPPQASYHRWVAGRWVHARQGWYWAEGHWT